MPVVIPCLLMTWVTAVAAWLLFVTWKKSSSFLVLEPGHTAVLSLSHRFPFRAGLNSSH